MTGMVDPDREYTEAERALTTDDASRPFIDLDLSDRTREGVRELSGTLVRDDGTSIPGAEVVPGPTLVRSMADYAEEFGSRRTSPARRLRTGWQALWLTVGEWMLRTFPFLQPPAEWALRRLDALARRWSRG
jgi:hypothetical protein